MPRYFFDTKDGETDTDQQGVELAGEDDAIQEAIRYAGALLKDDPSLLTAKDELVVTVRSGGSAVVARLKIQLSRS